MPEMMPTSADNPDKFLKLLEEHDVQNVEMVFTELRGPLNHTAQYIPSVDADMLSEGVYFDGSSISGWKSIDKSDMLLKPDLSRFYFDPFAAQPTVKIFCDVIEPDTGKAYNRCARGIAKRAEEYLTSTGLADTAYFGPEAEFFVFEDVRIHMEQNHVGYSLDSREGPYNSGRNYAEGNSGHRPKIKGGYFPEAPVDSLGDIRAEMCAAGYAMGVPMEKHHHEVAPSQCELGMRFAPLRECADNMQIYKYAVHNVADAYGMSATFLPKPVFGDNGSGMHCHQSLFKGKTPLFAGDQYANLSETALYYIGGIIKHARALNAFTNPSTNSYKRLVPGYEAPVLLAYSARNRSAACRIPVATSDNGRRVEVRFPDAMANPYLAFAALLMAGMDGIKHKIHPGDAMDQDLYALSDEELEGIPTVCSSLEQALDSLEDDHEFLLEGGVFDADAIAAFILLKREEVDTFNTWPHPAELYMYYSK